MEQTFQIRGYMDWELAKFYGCSQQSLRKQLRPFKKEIGQRLLHYYFPNEVEIIVGKLGWPKPRQPKRTSRIPMAMLKELNRARRINSKVLSNSEKLGPVVPTLTEFEAEFQEIFLEAEEEKFQLYSDAEMNGDRAPDVSIQDVPSVGSTKMVLKKSEKLYKWFLSIPSDPKTLYAININDCKVSISFRHLVRDRGLGLNDRLYKILANRLKEKFGWKIISDVRQRLPRGMEAADFINTNLVVTNWEDQNGLSLR